MTSQSASRIAVTSVIVTGLLASIDDVSKGKRPDVRIAIGVFLAGGVLLALAGPAPTLSAAFSAALLVSGLLTVGGKAIPILQGSVTK